MYKEIQEGKAKALVSVGDKISKELDVFYNPLMEYNRSISISLLNAIGKKSMQIADPLAGSGIRAVRFFKELDKGIIKKISINDNDKKSINMIKKNLHLNKIKTRFQVCNKDANLFLLESTGFDYIDIDPFGSPNKFLNSALERLSRDAILAVTATDTGALCGSFKQACLRKYWALPLHTDEMHEVGLRILIRKVQLIGIQFDKALIPILSYDKDHYMRIFFRCEKGKKICDKIVTQHQLYKGSGPIWIGSLKDQHIANKLDLKDRFTTIMKEELDILGFYEIPKIYKRVGFTSDLKITEILDKIRSQGKLASRTQFSDQGIKTDMKYDELLIILKSKSS